MPTRRRDRETAAGHPLSSEQGSVELEERMLHGDGTALATAAPQGEANALSGFVEDMQCNASATPGNEALGSANNFRRGTVRAVLSMPVRSLRMSMSSVNQSPMGDNFNSDAQQRYATLVFKDPRAEIAFGAFAHGDRTTIVVMFAMANIVFAPYTIIVTLTHGDNLSITIRSLLYGTLAVSLAALAMLFDAYRREATDRERAIELVRALAVTEHSPLDEDCDPQSFETDDRNLTKLEVASGVALAVIYLIFYTFAAGKAPENCSYGNDRSTCSKYILLDGGVAAAYIIPLAILPLRFAACVVVTVVCTSLFVLVREIPPLQHSTPEYRIVLSMFLVILTFISLWAKRLNEIESRAHFQELCFLERQREKSKRLAEYFSSIAASMIPERVAMRIARGEVYRERVDNGIVCCIGVRHFRTIATEWSSNDVVLMLQEAFVQLDAVVKLHEPYAAKVHSFGDEYIVTIRPGSCSPQEAAGRGTLAAASATPRRASLEQRALELKASESRSDSSATDDSRFCGVPLVVQGGSIDAALSLIRGIAQVSHKLCAQRCELCTDTICLDVAVECGPFFATTFGSQKNFLAVGPCVERCRAAQRGIESVHSIALYEHSLGREVPVVCVVDSLLPLLGNKFTSLQISVEPTVWPQLVDLENGCLIPRRCAPNADPDSSTMFDAGRLHQDATDYMDDATLAVFIYPSRLIAAPHSGGTTPVLEGSSSNTPLDSVNSVPRQFSSAAHDHRHQHQPARTDSLDNMEANQFLDVRISEPAPSSALPSALSNPLNAKCRHSHLSRMSSLGPPIPVHSPNAPSPGDRSPNVMPQSGGPDDALLMGKDDDGGTAHVDDARRSHADATTCGLVRVPCLPLFRFLSVEMEATYRAAGVQDSGPRIIGELCSFLAVFTGCVVTLSIEGHVEMVPSAPLLWACVGCVLSTCGALADGVLRAVHSKQLPHWGVLLLEAMLTGTYIAVIVLAKPTTSLLSKGHVMWLSVIVLLSMARERGTTVLQMWLADIAVSVPFLWLTWVQHDGVLGAVMVLMCCLFIIWACVCRGLIDRARRTRFLTAEESRLVQEQLIRDSEGLEELLESMVPNEAFAQLFRRARIASSPVIHSMRGLRGLLPRGTLFSTKVDVMSILQLSFSATKGEPPGSLQWWTACDAGLALVQQGLKAVKEVCVIKTSGDVVMVVDDSSQDQTEQAVTLLQLVAYIVAKARLQDAATGATATTVRAVLSSGPVCGAVLGIAALSFEYYGEPVVMGSLLLRELPAGCDVLATSRFVELLQWWSLFVSTPPLEITTAATMDCVRLGFTLSSGHAPPQCLMTSTQTSPNSEPSSANEEVQVRAKLFGDVAVHVRPVQLWRLRGVRAKIPVHVVQFGGACSSK